MPRVGSRKSRIISLDTETTGKDFYHSARPFFVTICDEAGETSYWEWDVDPLTRKPSVPLGDLDEIQKEIDRADIVVLQNAKFDVTALSMLYGGRLRWDWSKVRDTLLAGHLLASNQPHDLTSMSMVYLGVNILPLEDAIKAACQESRRMARSQYQDWRIAKVDDPEMPSVKDNTWAVDMWLPRAIARHEGYTEDHSWWTVLADYSNGDSSVTLPLWLKQEELIEKRGLMAIYLERMKLLPITQGMESCGITVSEKKLQESLRECRRISSEVGRTCVEIAEGRGFSLSLPKSGNNNSLREFLTDSRYLGLSTEKVTAKGGVCLDKSVMEEWSLRLPDGEAKRFVEYLIKKRKCDTSASYIEGYTRFWIEVPRFPGYYVLHPSLNPTGTVTLRWSSSNPNEQNIAGDRQEGGFNLRKMFGPLPGREWWSLDYENIEMRIPAYESGEDLMIDLFERPNDPPFFGSFHLLNFSIIYPKLFWPLSEEKGAVKSGLPKYYHKVKCFGFAKSYGAGPETADAAAGIKGAYALVEKQLKKHSQLNAKMIDMANRLGYVETIPDRSIDPSRGYPILCSRSKWGKVSPTTPLNYHVQSTAMWCTMKAMIRCDEELRRWGSRGFDARMVMQVHDEIVFDLPAFGKKNRGKIDSLKGLMERSGDDIGVPLRVSVSYHPTSWGESG